MFSLESKTELQRHAFSVVVRNLLTHDRRCAAGF